MPGIPSAVLEMTLVVLCIGYAGALSAYISEGARAGRPVTWARSIAASLLPLAAIAVVVTGARYASRVEGPPLGGLG